MFLVNDFSPKMGNVRDKLQEKEEWEEWIVLSFGGMPKSPIEERGDGAG